MSKFFLKEQILIKNCSLKESKKGVFLCYKILRGIKMGKLSKTLTILGGIILVGVVYSLWKDKKDLEEKNIFY